jgi:hypothetical protein
VKEWCEKDGGVTVYEKLELTKEEYQRNSGKNGFMRVLSENSSLPEDEYAWIFVDTKIHHLICNLDKYS